MALVAYNPIVYVNDQAPPQDDINLNLNENGLKAVTDEAILHAQKIADLEAPIFTPYVPQATAPVYVDGQVYYDDPSGTFAVQGKYPDVTLNMGREMHMEVINNTVDIIPNGYACRHSGTSNGIPEVELAIATSFDNARIMGVATHAIGVGEKGIITTFGEVHDVDTSLITPGVPLYLSDTIAGTWTETAPTIVSRVGGALTSTADGTLFVFIINNSNIPTIFGGMQGQTAGNETYSVTTTAQDIINYNTEKEVVVAVDALTGQITLPNIGAYRANFTASISFSSLSSTRSVTLELYDVTNTAIIYSYPKNIPRDARSEEHTSELQSPDHLVCRLLLEKKKNSHMLYLYVYIM